MGFRLVETEQERERLMINVPVIRFLPALIINLPLNNPDSMPVNTAPRFGTYRSEVCAIRQIAFCYQKNRSFAHLKK
jgi:hypothetical protein